MNDIDQAYEADDLMACYRHSDRATGVSCQRCAKPICTDCMRQASVGVHCPDCAQGSSQRVYTANTLPGAQGVVTTALIAINVAVWVLGMVYFSASPTATGSVFSELGTNASLVSIAGEWWRLVTGGFIHSGLIHIGFNMYLLWQLGRQLERHIGPVNFFAMYMAALLGGSLGAMVMEPNSLHGGASGAVFGLFGFMAMLYRSRGIPVLSSGIGRLILINLVITFAVPFVSQGGHIGGLIAGGILGAVYFGVQPGVPSPVPASGPARLIVTVGFGALLFVAGLLASSAGVG